MKIKQGTIAGVIFGLIAVAVMLPLPFPDKPAALLGAFINRFAIGFLIPNTSLPMSSWLKGITIALLLSLPDAIITYSYAPILIMGGLGGLLIGMFVKEK